MINTVIFDMDGLLIDSEMMWYQLYQRLLEPYGYGFSLEDYTQTYSGRVLLEILSEVKERFHLPYCPEKEVEELFSWEEEYIEKGIPLKSGARELLKYLKENHYKILLATSSVPKRAHKILESNEVDAYFDDMAFGSEVKRGKPYPDIFLKACEKVGEKPENCLVLEDSEAGVHAAYAAGIPVICIPDLKQPNQQMKEETTEILSSLYQVIDYLEKKRL